MKKILFLTNMYPSEKYPTFGIFVEKTFIWLNTDYKVKLIKIRKQTLYILKLIAYLKFYLSAILAGAFGNYDCIYAHFISHCAFPIKVIRFFNRKVIIIGNVHGEDVFSQYDIFRKNFRWAKVFLNQSDYLISPSEYYKNKIYQEYHYEWSKIFVSPSGGIDRDIFCPDEKYKCIKKLELDSNKKYIGYVSRIETGKGWDTFLSGAKLLIEDGWKDLEFIIVGEGSESENMRSYIKELGLQEKVKLFSLLPHKELHNLYNSLDIFCFPSRREAESLGLVGLEAMSCKVPCVVSNIGGILTFAQDNYNCKVFDALSHTDMLIKIKELLNMDKDQLEVLKNNAEKTAMKYEKKLVEKKFLEFFENIML